jgi:hypothetical protein
VKAKKPKTRRFPKQKVSFPPPSQSADPKSEKKISAQSTVDNSDALRVLAETKAFTKEFVPESVPTTVLSPTSAPPPPPSDLADSHTEEHSIRDHRETARRYRDLLRLEQIKLKLQTCPLPRVPVSVVPPSCLLEPTNQMTRIERPHVLSDVYISGTKFTSLTVDTGYPGSPTYLELPAKLLPAMQFFGLPSDHLYLHYEVDHSAAYLNFLTNLSALAQLESSAF